MLFLERRFLDAINAIYFPRNISQTFIKSSKIVKKITQMQCFAIIIVSVNQIYTHIQAHVKNNIKSTFMHIFACTHHQENEKKKRFIKTHL